MVFTCTVIRDFILLLYMNENNKTVSLVAAFESGTYGNIAFSTPLKFDMYDDFKDAFQLLFLLISHFDLLKQVVLD